MPARARPWITVRPTGRSVVIPAKAAAIRSLSRPRITIVQLRRAGISVLATP